MRLLERTHRHRRLAIFEIFSLVRELIALQRGVEAIERVEEDVARIVGVALVEFELERRDAAADANLEPAAAQMVEHADLFGQTQRRIDRQQIDQWPEMN